MHSISASPGERKSIKSTRRGTSRVDQWLRLHAPSTRDLSLIPGQGTRSQLGIAFIFKICIHRFGRKHASFHLGVPPTGTHCVSKGLELHLPQRIQVGRGSWAAITYLLGTSGPSTIATVRGGDFHPHGHTFLR